MPKKEGQYDQPQSLMTTTQKFLKGRDLFIISSETGIPFYWMRKFLSGAYKNPSVNRVQSLYEHLTNTSLIKG